MKKIFFLGPEGSYSHSVTKQVFQTDDVVFVPLQNFSEITKHVLATEQGIGVLPIENSITSDIHENIDFLFKNDVTIVDEAFLRINLHLLGISGATTESIKEVYSFERALAQCSEFIEKHNLKTHACDSTAQGKQIVLEKGDNTIGSIGSKALAEDGKMTILEGHIGNDKYNMTRFVFVSKEKLDGQIAKKNKASVIFKVPHIPGSLAKLLNVLAEMNLNLTKIESRPIPGTNWEYQFWVDIENPDEELTMQTITDLFKQKTLSYKILGIYPSGKVFES